MRRQDALTLISETVESDFSNTEYNCTYVGDVQSLIAKSTRTTKKTCFENFASGAFCCARQYR